MFVSVHVDTFRAIILVAKPSSPMHHTPGRTRLACFDCSYQDHPQFPRLRNTGALNGLPVVPDILQVSLDDASYTCVHLLPRRRLGGSSRSCFCDAWAASLNIPARANSAVSVALLLHSVVQVS